MVIYLDYDKEQNTVFLKDESNDEILYGSDLDFYLAVYEVNKEYINKYCEEALALQKTQDFLEELETNEGCIAFIDVEGNITRKRDNSSLEIFIPKNKDFKNIENYKEYVEKERQADREAQD